MRVPDRAGKTFDLPFQQRPDRVREPAPNPLAPLIATALGILVALAAGTTPAALANAPGNWGYTEKGADWGAEFPKCDGKAQTPIDIKDRDVEEERGESIIRQLNYAPADAEIENMGG